MTRVEREELLSETRCGVLSIAREGRGPIAVPVWHRWDADQGELHFTSGRYSRKGEALAAAGRASYTVQVDDMGKAKYVMVEGAVTFEEDFDIDLELIGTGKRYQGDEIGEAYIRSTYMDGDKVLYNIVLWKITAETWLSFDSTKVR